MKNQKQNYQQVINISTFYQQVINMKKADFAVMEGRGRAYTRARGRQQAAGWRLKFCENCAKEKELKAITKRNEREKKRKAQIKRNTEMVYTHIRNGEQRESIGGERARAWGEKGSAMAHRGRVGMGTPCVPKAARRGGLCCSVVGLWGGFRWGGRVSRDGLGGVGFGGRLV